ncbi:MAG: hypothetical protein ACI8X5_003987 [Planctomycetota bacterium]
MIETPPSGDGLAAILRARTGLHWENIDFVKPYAGSTNLDPYQAPILYRNVLEEGSFLEMGALEFSEGQPQVNADRPTVYYIEEKLKIGGRDHQQLTFLWTRKSGVAGEISLRGLRLTYDSEGFPAIYEVLKDTSGMQLFYVSRNLEQGAMKEFGAPLDGRDFAIEPAFEERPDVVVIRIVEQGPKPSGPIVYSASLSGDLKTLHCRCKSSQITSIRTMIEYEMEPWIGLDAKARESTFGPLGGFQPADWPVLSLRLPVSF